VASDGVRTHYGRGYFRETRTNGKNMPSRESKKRTWDEFVEASVKTSQRLGSIKISTKLALDIITKLGESETTGGSETGDKCCKCRRLGESIDSESLTKPVSKAKLLLRSIKGEIRDLDRDFNQLFEEGLAQYSMRSSYDLKI